MSINQTLIPIKAAIAILIVLPRKVNIFFWKMQIEKAPLRGAFS